MIVYNYIGLFMTIVAFAVAFGIGYVTGIETDGPFMLIAGLLLATLDVTYRLKFPSGHIYIPHKGGSLFFLPAWIFGIFWFVLGIFSTVQG